MQYTTKLSYVIILIALKKSDNLNTLQDEIASWLSVSTCHI